MREFVDALIQHRFLQFAVLTGLLASVACGIVGTFVVTRRITYIAGGIAHCVLGGLGAARYFQVEHGWAWLHPMIGAVVAALLAALIIGVIRLRGTEREDTIIGALWAVGMAVGILFITHTRGYSEDLMSYLFGNILMVSSRDLWLIAGLDVLVVGAGLLFYHPLQAVCFDEEFARLRGLRVELYYLLLLGLTALTVVLLTTVVGIVMVIALLTLPAAVAGHFARAMWQMMALATGLTAVITLTGLAVSYGPGLPAGATIILLAGAVYLFAILGTALRKKVRSS
ncbi:MAG: metal ABC transporter permease [Planctomycetota bacterium]